MTSSDNGSFPQFSLRSILIAISLAAVLLGIVMSGFVMRGRAQRLSMELELAKYNEQVSRNQLLMARGQSLRSDMSEYMLMQVLANEGAYPELFAALRNGAKQKVGFAIHPLDEDDNLTFGNFYPLGLPAGSTGFGHCFLLTENPLAISDYVSCDHGRMPGNANGRWNVETQTSGVTTWYAIEEGKFVQQQLERR